MNLAEKLVTLRKSRGLSQEALSEALGVSRQAIGKWETGQALPELPGLIALSRFYSVAIDSLVNDHPCDIISPAITATSLLATFLLRAKRATYAGHAPEIHAERRSAHEFAYTEDSWQYRDSYYGGHRFHGQEVVCLDGRAIWCMNYSGQTLADTFSGDFLKLALRHGTADMPYRGPQLFRSGDYTYVCDADGSLDWFCGTEAIYCQDTLVYECRFHGGYVQ
nr:helix-turn-helix transcriptional regulator [Clostridia bacterium]